MTSTQYITDVELCLQGSRNGKIDLNSQGYPIHKEIFLIDVVSNGRFEA